MRPTTRRMLEVIAAAVLLVSLPSPAQGATPSPGGCISSDPGRTARAASTPRDTFIAPGPTSDWSLHLVGEGYPADAVLGMAVTGPLTASVVWQGEYALRVALTTDGGVTWPTVVKFADPGDRVSVSMASSGRDIDILMTDQRTGRVLYRRSDDAGLTWTDPVLLGKVTRDDYGYPAAVIGRAPDGTVAAAWWWKSARLVVKVSHNAGQTFGYAHTIARWHPGSGGCASPLMEPPMVTLGRGVILVGGMVIGDGQMGILRSLDRGLTWSKPVALGYLRAMAAHGTDALITIDNGFTRVSRDRGRTWSAPQRSVADVQHKIAWSDGRWRVAMDTRRMSYRDSRDGVHWSQRSVFQDGGYPPAAVTSLDGHAVVVSSVYAISPSYPDQDTVVVAIRN